MTESSANIIPELKLLITLNKSLSEILLITLISTFLIWYAHYHWKRRKLYQMAAQINGPGTLPFLGNALDWLGSTSTDILNHTLRWTNEFESPVRIWLGQRLLFGIWSPNDIETIMNSPHALKKHELYTFLEVLGSNGLVVSPVAKWKRHRKIIAPTFNQKILDEFVEVFSEQSEVLVEQLLKETEKGIFDIHKYIGRFTLDIICETAMDVEVNAQTTDAGFFTWLTTALGLAYSRTFSVLYHSDFIFNRTSVAKDLYDAVKKINDFTSAVVTEKKGAYQKKLQENRQQHNAPIEEEPLKKKSFLQRLIELSEEGANFTDVDLLDEVKTLIMAGGDTTSSVASFVFIVLGMFPDIQDKVYEEITDVLGPDRSVQSKDLGKLQYLERVIKETMRLFPPVPLFGRDITGDIKLKNCTVPAGCGVFILLLSAQRDPSVWPNPLKFDPDRFLPEEIAKRHPYSYIPFSGGPRNCISLKYGMMSLKVLLAMVIRKYRFFVDYKKIEDIKLEVNAVLNVVNGYRVSIEPRE